MTLTPKAFRHLIETEHTDLEGLISADKNPGRWTSGNGALDTSLYYIILFLTSELKEADSIRFASIVSNLWSEGRPGLLSRNKGRPDQDAWDNYLGVCAAGLLCDAPSVPRAIRSYGEAHCWIYQNESGIRNLLSGTLFRFPGLVTTICLSCADSKPPSGVEFAGLGWRLNEPADNPGAARLKWLMALVVFYSYGVGMHRSLRDAAAFQLRCIQKQWGSYTGMMAAYYGADHPFAQIDIPVPTWLTKVPI